MSSTCSASRAWTCGVSKPPNRMSTAREGLGDSGREARELAGQLGVDTSLEQGAGSGVLAGEHLGLLVQSADEVAAVVRHEDLHVDGGSRELVGDQGAQLVQPGARAGRHDDRVFLVTLDP